MNTRHFFLYFLLCLSITACSPNKSELKQIGLLAGRNALLWPDYIDVTVPSNIAPLNCYIVPPHTSYTLKAYGSVADTVKMKGRYRIKFNEKAWHRLLEENEGGRIHVELQLKGKDFCNEYRFFIDVRDSIDPFMTCRLIEPSYQTSSLLQTIEFDLRHSTQRLLFDNRLQVFGCENCHTFAQGDGGYLIYHVRFNRTGTFIVRHDTVLRVNLKSERFPQGGVYPAWHPGKKMIAFGTSAAYPFVHSKDIVRRTEVYDSMGDIIVYDIDRNRIFTDRRISSAEVEETFPWWSPDGKYLYLCQSPNPLRDSAEDDVDYSRKIKYNLIRIAFDEKTQTFGQIDTLVDAAVTRQTVSFPRISPDNRFLAFCLSDHGTFPIRHPESDLYLIDLQNPNGLSDSAWIPASKHYAMKRMEHINSQFTESYHTWSSNSRWLMFSSKREDNLYSRPYFTYVDTTGSSTKPFMLPQKDPIFYLTFLKSYNVPELARTPSVIDATDAKDFSLMPVIVPDTILIR